MYLPQNTAHTATVLYSTATDTCSAHGYMMQVPTAFCVGLVESYIVTRIRNKASAAIDSITYSQHCKYYHLMSLTTFWWKGGQEGLLVIGEAVSRIISSSLN